MHFKTFLSGLLVSVMLAGCAGGDGTTLAEGGIGGTGVSVGPITGFGSVWVNGVRYDVGNAEFIRDGVMVQGQSEYQLGEVVTVRGTVNSDGVSGQATQVSFENALLGAVTNIVIAENTVEVLGQKVRLNALTLLHGFALLTDLKAGNVLEVSGSKNSQGVITASSISLKQAQFEPGVSTQVLKGRVEQLNVNAQQFVLGGVVVDYSAAVLNLPGTAPVNGQYVEVRSQQTLSDNRLLAAQLALVAEYPVFREGQEVELEGRITRFRNSRDFAVSGVDVITIAETEFEDGLATDLQLDSLVEVEGEINNAGVLVAEEVSVRQQDSEHELAFEGQIAALNAATQELTLLGNTIVVDNRTILVDEQNDQERSIRFSDLRVSDQIEVSGRALADGRILALRIDREEAEGSLEVKGVCSAFDSAAGTLVIQGVSVLADTNAKYKNNLDQSVTQQQFFSALTAGRSIVEVEGTSLGNDWIRAEKLEIKTP